MTGRRKPSGGRIPCRKGCLGEPSRDDGSREQPQKYFRTPCGLTSPDAVDGRGRSDRPKLRSVSRARLSRAPAQRGSPSLSSSRECMTRGGFAGRPTARSRWTHDIVVVAVMLCLRSGAGRHVPPGARSPRAPVADASAGEDFLSSPDRGGVFEFQPGSRGSATLSAGRRAIEEVAQLATQPARCGGEAPASSAGKTFGSPVSTTARTSFNSDRMT